MSATRAFDLALFVGTPANINDGVLVSALGPPFTAAFTPVVTAPGPGVVVGASMPAATAPNQILISGAGAGFPWALGTNPAASAAVPPPQGPNQILLSDGTPSWQANTISNLMILGGAVTITGGGSFVPAANLNFNVSATPQVRINGVDPTLSLLDNFGIDCGTF